LALIAVKLDSIPVFKRRGREKFDTGQARAALAMFKGAAQKVLFLT
jgi:hypothetical protein